ncbi:uncharacterized protein LOC131305382 [Rhododendron vialii]|uniref:uncharacterized protein LOC131305382 n=1 Tax=Rhododendron vialii TaxID=182163 RepID=UPI00265E06D2|nr:uncharacterized protein LOC131305382 [Rhododendron vialii]
MGEVVLFMEELKPSSATVASCRICHGDEEEESQESCKSLEVPCACSGTLMFAHRDCIQRWCNQKGNTTCEICLQKFEPGYTTPPRKSQLIDSIVTIRGSLEVLRREQELQHPGLVPTVEAEGRMLETNNSSEGSSAPDWSAIWCRSLVLVLTFLLLARHLLLVLSTVGMKDFPFTFVTLIVLRAGEILLTVYLLVWVMMAIRNNIKRQH